MVLMVAQHKALNATGLATLQNGDNGEFYFANAPLSPKPPKPSTLTYRQSEYLSEIYQKKDKHCIHHLYMESKNRNILVNLTSRTCGYRNSTSEFTSGKGERVRGTY